MDSSTVFWFATITMSVLAIAFVAGPFARQQNYSGLIGIGTALPVFATGLYLFVGAPQAADLNGVPDIAKADGHQAQPSVSSVASLVDGLAERLRNEPGDAQGWLLLARSYHHLQRPADALAAYRRATDLGAHDPSLAEIAAAAGTWTESPAGVYGSVSLSEPAAHAVLPTDTVYVFARAVNGPSMPVAVLKRPAAELPMSFRLDDGQAMSPDMKLSSYEQVVVTARISRSGAVSDVLKGLEATSGAVVIAENQHLDLIIE